MALSRINDTKLKVGTTIAPRFPLSAQRMRGWKYENECCELLGVTYPAEVSWFEVVETGPLWVKVSIPNNPIDGYLKLSADELDRLFLLVS